ncbi:MAG: general stress protein [Bacillota bacterium]|nr:general stress protein [Bacillota bacterium]MDP4169434.1 general stress protein [Bacillota bacterium]
MTKVRVVENGVQATEKINTLMTEGYTKEEIFLFAHDENRSEHLTEATDTGEMGIMEKGLFTSVGNLFKSRGDELRSHFESLGLSQQQAMDYEKELDKGRLVLVACRK